MYMTVISWNVQGGTCALVSTRSLQSGDQTIVHERCYQEKTMGFGKITDSTFHRGWYPRISHGDGLFSVCSGVMLSECPTSCFSLMAICISAFFCIVWCQLMVQLSWRMLCNAKDNTSYPGEHFTQWTRYQIQDQKIFDSIPDAGHVWKRQANFSAHAASAILQIS